jgi:hypothetical protein
MRFEFFHHLLRMGLCAESIAPALFALIMRPVVSTSSQ